jgi:hypothetical protein
VELLGGFLETEGIPFFVPDATTKTMDPFITGANAFSCALLVPREMEGRARTLLAERMQEGADITREIETDASTEELRDEATALEVEALARRTRWAALFLLTAPLALWFGWKYLGLSRRLGVRSQHDHLTLAAMVLAVVTVALQVVFLRLFGAA